MYKSQLQEFCQKTGLAPPVYEFTKEGPSHAPRYKATVTVKDVQYISPTAFTNLKKAEQAAAKAALDAVVRNHTGNSIHHNRVEESGLCKNLLQEYMQKLSLPLPIYRTVRMGEVHAATFNSTVEIAGRVYEGGAAKSKKEAEIKSARAALLAIYSETHAGGQVAASF